MSTAVEDQKHVRPQDTASNAEDPEIRDFYGPAVSEAYRLKSELVAQHLAKIGMGRSVFCALKIILPSLKIP